ncbi:pentatricopeptide repeat-containing protein At1g80270, mitochondrial-like [Musa acuminata AAA Group]|uniref:pentatricopeptide repeat-containing protein At1g80270, mitochondrial n=1 Tax=Musa acuminata AAA Group TaxID=214697 RepID=UPI0031D02B97
MLGLRRAAASSTRVQNCSILLARACCADSVLSRNYLAHEEGHHDKSFSISGSSIISKLYSSECLYHTSHTKSFLWRRNLSSHARARSGQKDDDLEDGFSDLDVPPEDDAMVGPKEKEANEELMSEEETNNAADDELSFLDSETDLSVEKKTQRRVESQLSKIIIENPRYSLNAKLDKWVEEGNPLGRGEISLVLLNLRKHRLYGKALQFVEWLEATNNLEFLEHDYATHLDLVAKAHGIQKAEKYIEEIPKSLRGEVLYRTLLYHCVSATDVKKAEDVFNRIKALGVPISAFACNQLLLLYKWVDQKKIADVLVMMEKENVKPNLVTYRLLIDTKGRAYDISGMEQILDTMKAEGVEPDLPTHAMVARHYVFAGLNEKAEATMREMEGDDIKENRAACRDLLRLYAALGKADDVERIWNICMSNPRIGECLAAIEAWGKLGQVENAEEVFENMLKIRKKLPTKYYNTLLKVYANNKLVSKGKELAKRMSDNGCYIGPMTWDGLIKLYAKAGELEKADSILLKASKQNESRPLFGSYMTVLDRYSARGDIHNAEKIFQRLKQIGYAVKLRPYQLLLQTYINAKSPAYGFRERMKADNISPNRAMAIQLTTADALRKTQISELLD